MSTHQPFALQRPERATPLLTSGSQTVHLTVGAVSARPAERVRLDSYLGGRLTVRIHGWGPLRWITETDRRPGWPPNRRRRWAPKAIL